MTEELPTLLYAEKEEGLTVGLLKKPNGHRFIRYRGRHSNSRDMDLVPGALSAGWDGNGGQLPPDSFVVRALAFLKKNYTCCACERVPAVHVVYATLIDDEGNVTKSDKPRPLCAKCEPDVEVTADV